MCASVCRKRKKKKNGGARRGRTTGATPQKHDAPPSFPPTFQIMVLIVLAIFALSLVAVFASYAPAVRAGPPAASAGLVVALGLFLAFVVAAVAAYGACVAVAPGHVPDGWHPFASDEVCERERVEVAREASWVFDAPSLQPPLTSQTHSKPSPSCTTCCTRRPRPPPPARWARPRARAGAKSAARGNPSARTTIQCRGGACCAWTTTACGWSTRWGC